MSNKNPTPARPMRVWWIPQVPGKQFHVDVETLVEAKKLLTTLAKYDLFQLEHNIKPDYNNAGGLEVYIDGEWEEYEDEYGDDITNLTLDSCKSIDARGR